VPATVGVLVIFVAQIPVQKSRLGPHLLASALSLLKQHDLRVFTGESRDRGWTLAELAVCLLDRYHPRAASEY